MDMGSLDEHLRALLRPSRCGPGYEHIGNIGFHRFEIDLRLPVIGDQVDPELFKERLILLIAGQEQNEISANLGLIREMCMGRIDGFEC